jgi:opacity protein-like surface antigen
MGGIGIGLKTGFLRVDTTVDYHSQAAYKDATPCWTAGCGANTVANTARVDSLSLMLNGYLDLGTWYSLTPYIGAGAGLGMITLRDFNAMSFTGAGVQTITNMGSQSRQNIAFSLMAGTAYSINKNLAIDIGYRYLNLGQGWTKATVQAGAASPAEQWTTGRITAHELRAGIRYTLD